MKRAENVSNYTLQSVCPLTALKNGELLQANVPVL